MNIVKARIGSLEIVHQDNTYLHVIFEPFKHVVILNRKFLNYTYLVNRHEELIEISMEKSVVLKQYHPNNPCHIETIKAFNLTGKINKHYKRSYSKEDGHVAN